jgi:hypothetical protein
VIKVRRNCREVTRLVLESEERPLSVLEQVSLRLHWRVCAACSRFREQAKTMRMALGRWRSYRDGSD